MARMTALLGMAVVLTLWSAPAAAQPDTWGPLCNPSRYDYYTVCITASLDRPNLTVNFKWDIIISDDFPLIKLLKIRIDVANFQYPDGRPGEDWWTESLVGDGRFYKEFTPDVRSTSIRVRPGFDGVTPWVLVQTYPDHWSSAKGVVRLHLSGFTTSPDTGERTIRECLDDAGSQGRGRGVQWDPKVGQCLAADPGEVAKIEEFIEAGRYCGRLHGNGASGLRMSDEVDDLVKRCVTRILKVDTEGAEDVITVAGVALFLGAMAVGAPSVATGALAFTVVFTAARVTGLLPQDHITRALRDLLNRIGGARPFAGIQASEHDWVKVQSTNPDAMSFSFADDGNLLFTYNRAEPAEFVWTLMSGGTPVGSLVIPYVPGPAPVVPALPAAGLAMLAAVLTIAGLRRRHRERTLKIRARPCIRGPM